MDAASGDRPPLRPAASAMTTDPENATAAVTALYHQHYVRLVRLAWLLTRDQGRAEELVQDAFIDLHQRWARMVEPAGAAGYLRMSVVNRARSSLRHQKVVQKYQPIQIAEVEYAAEPSAEHGAMNRLEQQLIISSVNGLPTRQREVLILRYYGQLSEAEIAETLGISRGAVKSHSSRGLRALRPVLGAQA